MSGSVNRVIIIGNVGQDPEIRTTQSGSKIANLSVATSESWKDKTTGEKREKTEWHRVSVFSDGLVKVIEQWVKKGSKVYLEGQLQTRKWVDQAGVEKYTTEIVLQGFNASLVLLDHREGSSPKAGPERQKSREPAFESGGLDDDIPF